jgi:hypothetical protein
MTIRQAIVFLLAILAPAPALADLTATYVAPHAFFTMTIEIAANGDLRGDVGIPGSYFITRAGHSYFISPRPSGPVVMRVEDMAAVVAEHIAKTDPHFRGEMGAAHKPNLVEKGNVVINGRIGSAWYLKMENGKLSPSPVTVISLDPALAPLGRAMTMQFEISAAMMGTMVGTSPSGAMEDILKTGAPLSFAGAELKTVSTAPIPSERFELPAEPATLDVARKTMTPATPKP